MSRWHHRGDLLACHIWALYQRLGLVGTRRALRAGSWTLDKIALGYRVRPSTRARIWARLFELNASNEDRTVHS